MTSSFARSRRGSSPWVTLTFGMPCADIRRDVPTNTARCRSFASKS